MAAGAAVHPRTPVVEPLPLVATMVSFGPPARVRSGRLGYPGTAYGQQRSRCAAAAHAQPARLRECRKRVHTGQGRYGRKAGRSVAVVRVSLEGRLAVGRMYTCGSHARALHKRTSIATPLPAAERLVAAATAAAATPRSRTIEPRPPPAMAATIERPVRVRKGCG